MNSDDINKKLNELNNTEDHTAEYDPQDIQTNKVFAILAYLSWLVLIPLFLAKESKYARFHANQGLVLAIPEIVCWAVLGGLSKIPVIGFIFGIINGLASLVFLIMVLIGIVNAATGKAKELPIIGNIRVLH